MDVRKITLRFTEDGHGEPWIAIEVTTVEGNVIKVAHTELDSSVISVTMTPGEGMMKGRVNG